MPTQLELDPPRRTAPFEVEPGFYRPANLWLYGNARLLDASLAHIPHTLGLKESLCEELDEIERDAEQLVLSGKILVTGIHSPPHQRAAVVPLRWGSPRVVILACGFHYHLGTGLRDELFPVARLWRYQFDPYVDLVISRHAPGDSPRRFSSHSTLDRLVREVAGRNLPGSLFDQASFRPNGKKWEECGCP